MNQLNKSIFTTLVNFLMTCFCIGMFGFFFAKNDISKNKLNGYHLVQKDFMIIGDCYVKHLKIKFKKYKNCVYYNNKFYASEQCKSNNLCSMNFKIQKKIVNIINLLLLIMIS
jgi:hypothetical protein